MFTGNRGILHKPDGTLGTSRWTHKHWLVCDLKHPRGTYHGPMPDRGWSALFFLDEAVALAAGHRPCHYCRRAAYLAWKDAWGTGFDRMAADTALHRARVTRTRQQIRFEAEADHLPDGTFVVWDGRAHLVKGPYALPFEPGGYGPLIDRPQGRVTVLTPAPTLEVLRAGYRPVLHPTAEA